MVNIYYALVVKANVNLKRILEMTKLDSKKADLEIYKLTIQVFAVGATALSTGIISMIRNNDFSLWLAIGIFVDLIFIFGIIFYLIKCYEVSDEMEDLK